MLRVRIISNIAVAQDLFSVKKQNQYTEQYQKALELNPKLSFIDWIRNNKILNSEQIEALRKLYLAAKLQCKRCEHEFQVKETDYLKPLLCPNCGSEALEILVKREGKFVKDDSKAISTEVLDIEQTAAMLVGDGFGLDELYPNDIINKNLQIIAKVGQGGMGSVYKAKHLNLNVFRAIKVLNPKLTKDADQTKRFIREARSAAVLDHQNIVKVHNVDNDDGKLFIEMEWVEGDSIQDKIKKGGNLSIEETVDYIIQAARGLSSAHRKGIIHRDIKPDNLMVTVENVVKVADFGLAKPSDSSIDVKISQSGTILGTPYYMSPEQAQNQDLTYSTDIYSLGVTFYHMLTGEVPYVGESAIQVLFQHIKSPFPSIRKKLPNMPVEIDHLILRMTAKNPQMRPEDLIEVIDELESIREKYDLVPVRFTDFRAYSGKKKKSKTAALNKKKRKSPMILFLFFAAFFLLSGLGALWWEFGNLSEIYDKYLKKYFVNEQEQPLDENADNEGKIPNSKKNKETSETTKKSVNVKPTEEQLKIKRNKSAGRKFRALRDNFVGKNFSEYLHKLENLRNEYSDTTIIADVEEEIKKTQKNRETTSNSWWLKNRENFIKLTNEKRFVEAYKILDSFPADFANTEKAKIIDSRKDSIRKDALLEKEAEVLYQEFIELTKLEKVSKAQIEHAQEIHKVLKDKYSDTRFATKLKAILDFVQIAQKNYDEEQKRIAFEANKKKYEEITQQVEKLIKDSNYEGVIEFLIEQKMNFEEDSIWRNRVDEEIKSKTDEVEELFRNSLEQAKKQAAQGKYLGAESAEGILKSVIVWGLKPMRTKATELLQTYYLEYINLKLKEYQDDEKFESAVTECVNFIKDSRFKEHWEYIEFRKKEFELFAQGFVKIAAKKVPALNIGKPAKTWELKEFYISKFEITNKQFLKFVKAKGYEARKFWSDEGWKLLQEGKFRYAGGDHAPKSWGASECEKGELNQPVTGISYYEAEAFCNFMGWSLPTPEQWLLSAGWDSKKKEWRKYPWGGYISKDEKNANFSSNDERAKIADVGAFKRDKSFFGLFDCAGNAREWVKSAQKSEKANVLGGHFLQTDIKSNAEIGKINLIKKSQRESYTGFRCVVILMQPDTK